MNKGMNSGSGSSRSRSMIPEARQALDNMKYEIANQLGVNYQGDKGNLTSRENGSVGGEMVRRMISDYEQSMANGTK